LGLARRTYTRAVFQPRFVRLKFDENPGWLCREI
jgi:hypothetical protein